MRKLGKIYETFSGFFGFISRKVLGLFPETKVLSYELYSADINYSVAQYLAMSSVILFFANFLLIGCFFVLSTILKLSYWIPVVLSIFMIIFSIFFVLKYPTSVAKKRANLIDANLPFALRHMAMLLRSGMDLYKVVKTVSVADYGVLSDELMKTVLEVEEGADIKDSLRALSLRTKSLH